MLSPNESERVMVVDDDPLWTLQMTLALEKAEIEHLCVQDTTNIMEDILEFKPNILLLDIDMPKHSGLEIAELVRCDPRTRTIPIAFVTASDSKEDILYGLRTHIIDYYSKPTPIKMLLQDIRVRHWVNSERASAEQLQRVIAEVMRKYDTETSEPLPA